MPDIKSFYKIDADKKTIDPDLFDKTAKAIADSFFEVKENRFTVGVSITQLRRLYDEVKRFQQRLEIAGADTETWEKELPYIKMIKSKVNYTVARMVKTKPKAAQYYKNLSSFIYQSIDLIKTMDDYFVFCSLFEAVYGFYYEHAPKD